MSELRIISIVDDDVSIRTATESLVRSLGFEAAAFDSAESFLESPRALDSACLITDVQMPGMDGLEMFRRLLAADHLIPTIFMTAFPKPGLVAQATAAGALAVLEKPFDGRLMVDFIFSAVGQRDC